MGSFVMALACRPGGCIVIVAYMVIPICFFTFNLHISMSRSITPILCGTPFEDLALYIESTVTHDPAVC